MVWGGAAVAVAALGAYFTTVELEQADQLAGVISLFVAVAGLGVAIVGLRSGPGGGPGGRVRQVAKARGNSQIYQAGRDLTQHPSQRPGSKAGEGGQDSDGSQGEGTLGDGPREVSQRAEADRGSRVRQAGRDLTTGDADDGDSDGADEEDDTR